MLDYIVIGSGFGGSVAALRLAEKGYSVRVIEEGRRYDAKSFPKSNWNLRKSLFVPILGLRGIMRMDHFRGLTILSGAGVGGGSLVYANTLITPSRESFANGTWPDDVGVASWAEELEPHYATAKRMLGVARAPVDFAAEGYIKATAEDLGYGATFRPVDVGVYFGQPGVEHADPYFDGAGPKRTGCTMCGGCMVGCRVGAKNTLDRNYLYLAEKRGVEVLSDTAVELIASAGDHYEVTTRRAGIGFARTTHRARKVIVAAGVLGTMKILLRCRDQAMTLPAIGARLGEDIRTNNESLIGVTTLTGADDLSRGLAIGAQVQPNAHTKIEGVRYPRGSGLLGLLSVPLNESRTLAGRWAKVLFEKVFHPIDYHRFTSPIGWAQRTIIVLVMQNLDSKMRFAWGRRLSLLFRRGLVASYADGVHPPVLIEEGNRFARNLAARIRGHPGSSILDLLGQSFTAHVLGGCPMGGDPRKSVIDGDHQVHGYPGLYVLGGASIPANLGVNPSLTITAMAERAMARVPVKKA